MFVTIFHSSMIQDTRCWPGEVLTGQMTERYLFEILVTHAWERRGHKAKWSECHISCLHIDCSFLLPSEGQNKDVSSLAVVSCCLPRDRISMYLACSSWSAPLPWRPPSLSPLQNHGHHQQHQDDENPINEIPARQVWAKTGCQNLMYRQFASKLWFTCDVLQKLMQHNATQIFCKFNANLLKCKFYLKTNHDIIYGDDHVTLWASEAW